MDPRDRIKNIKYSLHECVYKSYYKSCLVYLQSSPSLGHIVRLYEEASILLKYATRASLFDVLLNQTAYTRLLYKHHSYNIQNSFSFFFFCSTYQGRSPFGSEYNNNTASYYTRRSRNFGNIHVQ